MTENDFQGHLVREAKAAQGCAFKLSHRMLAGIPDLFIKLPNLPGVFIECKMLQSMPKRGMIPVKMTKLQRLTLEKMQQAGQPAGWAVCIDQGREKWIVTGTDVTATSVALPESTSLMMKKHGKPWPISQVVRSILGQSESKEYPWHSHKTLAMREAWAERSSTKGS